MAEQIVTLTIPVPYDRRAFVELEAWANRARRDRTPLTLPGFPGVYVIRFVGAVSNDPDWRADNPGSKFWAECSFERVPEHEVSKALPRPFSLVGVANE